MAICAVFVLVYGPDCGRGLITDDFAWIAHGRFDGADSVWRILMTAQGFYRPMVSYSFGLNEHVFGLNATGFGWTNLTLALACGGLLATLGRQLGLAAGPAMVAATIWLFNFHGIGMSVLWVSGRTSLLLSVFALLAVIAFIRGRTGMSALFVALAMLSKEEAVVLPAFFTVWTAVARRGAVRRVGQGVKPVGAWGVAPAWAALVFYLLVRRSAGALWPTNAPDFYRFTFEAGTILTNLVEYADRSMTFAAATVLLTAVYVRQRWVWSERTTAIGIVGGLWLLLGFGVTLFLPVRSSLYAVFPSIGVALVAAAIIGDITARLDETRGRRLATAGVLLLVCLVPVYWSRNVRWTELADLSRSAVEALRVRSTDWPPGASIAVYDDVTRRANLRNAWGALVPEMSRVMLDGRWEIVLLDPEMSRDRGRPFSVVLRLSNGTLVPADLEPD